MRLVKAVSAALIGSGILASAAQATLTVSMVRTPIAANSRTDETGGKLAITQYPRTFDIKVTQTGEHWASGALNITLNQGSMASNTGTTAGTFYVPTAGDGDTSQANAWNGVGFRQLQFDTFVTTPDSFANVVGKSTTVLGLSDYPNNQAGSVSLMPQAANNKKSIDITWGDQNAGSSTLGDGAYTIARLTVRAKSGGVILGHVGGTSTPFNAQAFNFTIPVFGDFNEDGVLNNTDINAFVQALTSPTAYATAHPNANKVWVGDFDDNGAFNNSDINGFVGLLTATPGEVTPAELAQLSQLVPEPTSMSILGLGLAGLMARRRK